MHRTTSYTIDTPTELWEAFKALNSERPKVNERIVELVAEDVRDRTNGDLDPQVRAEITGVLGGEDGV